MIKTPIKFTQYLAAASLFVVFIIDIITPTEFVADILYLCCILLVFKENTQTIICFGAAACLLIIIDVLFVEMNLKFSLSHLINRGMSIVAILAASYVTVRYRNLNQASMLKEQRYLKALEQMLFITSHHVRKPVANILGLIDIINNENTDLPACDLKDSYRYLRSSAIELDNIIKELNTLIEETEQQNNTNSIIEPVVVLLTGPNAGQYFKDGVLMQVVS